MFSSAANLLLYSDMYNCRTKNSRDYLSIPLQLCVCVCVCNWRLFTCQIINFSSHHQHIIHNQNSFFSSRLFLYRSLGVTKNLIDCVILVKSDSSFWGGGILQKMRTPAYCYGCFMLAKLPICCSRLATHLASKSFFLTFNCS